MRSDSRITRALYRVQSRLGLTGPEGTALLLVALALIIGLTVAEARQHRAPDYADLYAATDPAFARTVVPIDSAAAPATPGPIDLNHAPTAALQTLPGIGPALAERIVQARPFRDLDDVQARVAGIGPAKAEALADLVRFISQ